MPLDLDYVRGHFPGLASPWAFMDNAGGSHVLAAVADRVRDFLLTTPVQHGAGYGPSAEAARDIVFPRAKLVIFVHGCFWHQHQGRRLARGPRRNLGYWEPKLAGNVARDLEAREPRSGRLAGDCRLGM